MSKSFTLSRWVQVSVLGVMWPEAITACVNGVCGFVVFFSFCSPFLSVCLCLSILDLPVSLSFSLSFSVFVLLSICHSFHISTSLSFIVSLFLSVTIDRSIYLCSPSSLPSHPAWPSLLFFLTFSSIYSNFSSAFCLFSTLFFSLH